VNTVSSIVALASAGVGVFLLVVTSGAKSSAP
jgi:hypothetical protein